MKRDSLPWLAGGALSAFAALMAVVAVVRSAAPPPPVEVRTPDAPTSDGVVKVYITGAVARPGVYQARQGDRYGDALELAGGPTDDAEPLAVNLAKRVRDEDHIHVPKRGEVPTTGSLVIGASAQAPVDLNSATQAQLEALPGIGPTRARQIVESRSRDGAFRRPEDLVQRKLLPQSVFDPLRDLVQVR